MCLSAKPNVSLLWSFKVLFAPWLGKHFVPPGLKTKPTSLAYQAASLASNALRCDPALPSTYVFTSARRRLPAEKRQVTAKTVVTLPRAHPGLIVLL